MNRFLAGLLLLGCVSGSAGQQTNPEQEVRTLEQHWLENESNPEALEGILADDFIHVVGVGLVTKREQLDYMRKHPSPEKGDRHFEELRVRVYGDTAIANGIVAAKEPDNLTPRRTGFTDVFVRHSGKWQAVSAQELPLPPPK